MLARVARFDHLPEDLDADAVDLLRQTVRSTPGYVAGFHMLDPKTRRALSITVFEDRDALERTGEALDARPDDRKVGIVADDVQIYEDTFLF
jgi:hypothetical protein